jgi:hypothetical protein
MQVFEAKTMFGELIYRDWEKWAKQNRSKTFENIRKRSKNDVKCAMSRCVNAWMSRWVRQDSRCKTQAEVRGQKAEDGRQGLVNCGTEDTEKAEVFLRQDNRIDTDFSFNHEGTKTRRVLDADWGVFRDFGPWKPRYCLESGGGGFFWRITQKNI